MFNLTGILFLISKHFLKTNRMPVKFYFSFAGSSSDGFDNIFLSM